MQKGRALDVWFQHTFSNSVGTARTHQQQQPARNVTPAARISSGTSNQPTPIPAPGDGLEGTDPSGVRRVLCLLPGGRTLRANRRYPPRPWGEKRASSFSVRYLCTRGSRGCVSQVSCSSCCRRCPASAAAGPSPCPPRPRRLPPTTAAWRWGVAGCRLAPLPARCCCPPRRRGSGSGCAGCPAGAGRGRWLGWAAASGCSPPRRPRCWGPRSCRHRRWGTRRRRASSSAVEAGGGTGGSARSWTTRTWWGVRPRAAHALRRGKDPSAAPGAPHAPAAGEEGRGRGGSGASRPRGVSAPPPGCPRRFLSAAAPTPGSGHRCPPQRRGHRGRCRVPRPLTSYGAAGSQQTAAGRDESARRRWDGRAGGRRGVRGRLQLPSPASDREPPPAPSAARADPPPNGSAQTRHPAATGRGGQHARPLGSAAAPALTLLLSAAFTLRSEPIEKRRCAEGGGALRRGGGMREMGCGSAEGGGPCEEAGRALCGAGGKRWPCGGVQRAVAGRRGSLGPSVRLFSRSKGRSALCEALSVPAAPRGVRWL